MASIFPSEEWLIELKDHLNSDEKYGTVAHNWEGDILFNVLASGALEEDVAIYLDLWHGECRGVKFLNADETLRAKVTLTAPFVNFVDVLQGRVDPMQAMMTRKLVVQGSMTYMMRNVPTVLQFLRCCQEVTGEVVGE